MKIYYTNDLTVGYASQVINKSILLNNTGDNIMLLSRKLSDTVISKVLVYDNIRTLETDNVDFFTSLYKSYLKEDSVMPVLSELGKTIKKDYGMVLLKCEDNRSDILLLNPKEYIHDMGIIKDVEGRTESLLANVKYRVVRCNETFYTHTKELEHIYGLTVLDAVKEIHTKADKDITVKINAVEPILTITKKKDK